MQKVLVFAGNIIVYPEKSEKIYGKLSKQMINLARPIYKNQLYVYIFLIKKREQINISFVISS